LCRLYREGRHGYHLCADTPQKTGILDHDRQEDMRLTVDTGVSLMYSILESPRDDLPRLALADWFEENGRDNLADFIRGQLTLDPVRQKCSCGSCVRKRGGGQHTNGTCACDDMDTRDILYRELELFPLVWEEMTGDMPLQCLHNREPLYRDMRPGDMSVVFRRGFIARIALTQERFLKHADIIFSKHPIEEVVLRDRAPSTVVPIFEGREYYRWYCSILEYLGEYPYVSPEDRSMIVKGVAGLLEGEVDERDGFREPLRRRYNSIIDANAYLSKACIAYGRAAVGLPPLE
jgi:uncharacterized protein (TIGR02996 family)